MSRNTISTGLKHQREVAVWVRRRLTDSRGGRFETGSGKGADQYGVILADGVGLGKTWEALAASALLLVESSKTRSTGGHRKNIRQQAARVLVLCPPGLVTKWSREIRNPDGFGMRLKRWAGSRPRRQFVLKTLTEPYAVRRRSDLKDVGSGTIRRAKVLLPEGTYICNWNVLLRQVGSGRSRLAALRNQPWDVLIVDEAHHREAREAIDVVWDWTTHLLLLTATPFQLEPRELHDVFGAIIDTQHGYNKVLSREPVRTFVRRMSEFFEGAEPPTRKQRRVSENVLRQALVRSRVGTAGRRFFLIDDKGQGNEMRISPNAMNEGDLRMLVPLFIRPSGAFEDWYLRRRLMLSDGPRTFVPTKLRRALSTAREARAAFGPVFGPPESPRLEALARWARVQAEVDLLKTADDGYPRKILVFTSFVGPAAREIEIVLAKALDTAWRSVRSHRRWKRLSVGARRGIEAVAYNLEQMVERDSIIANAPEARQLVKTVRSMAEQRELSLSAELFGHPRYRRLVTDDLSRRLKTLSAVLKAKQEGRWFVSLTLQELNSVRSTIRSIKRLELVRRYTGRDDRRERDASGEAFRSPLAPWALVASNVGSEGIDLHSFSAHLVHFDIEWNPARMEQREGRIDRFGRILKEPVNVYFLLVRGTYDERMLHQLVARQRWHTILLGKSGARLRKATDQDGGTDRIIGVKQAQELALDLRPSIRSK